MGWRPVTLAAASAAALAVLAVVAAGELRAAEPKVIVLGFDGADPALATRFMEEGHLAKLQRLEESVQHTVDHVIQVLHSFSTTCATFRNTLLPSACPRAMKKGYNPYMSVKNPVKKDMIRLIEEQPDDSSYDEILRELAFARMVDRGLEDATAGRTVSDEEMKKAIDSWRK